MITREHVEKLRELIAREITYPGFEFDVSLEAPNFFLYARFRTGSKIHTTRKWRLSVHMTQSEVVQTAFKCVLTAVEHECREQFLYRGAAVFGPHMDVDALRTLVLEGRLSIREEND